jgi:hypothetical protein
MVHMFQQQMHHYNNHTFELYIVSNNQLYIENTPLFHRNQQTSNVRSGRNMVCIFRRVHTRR